MGDLYKRFFGQGIPEEFRQFIDFGRDLTREIKRKGLVIDFKLELADKVCIFTFNHSGRDLAELTAERELKGLTLNEAWKAGWDLRDIPHIITDRKMYELIERTEKDRFRRAYELIERSITEKLGLPREVCYGVVYYEVFTDSREATRS
ncbi:MAG: hypothetical protein AABW89_01810 [Nanoarchaeota archaeon]